MAGGTGVCNLHVDAAKILTATFIDVYGDADGNGTTNLSDSVLVLRNLANLGNAGTVNIKADVNGDGKLGLAEVIYIMQKVAGIR